MKYFFTFLVTNVVVLLSYQSTLSQKLSQETIQLLPDMMVRIVTDTGTGSGFFINKNHIATAYHVIESNITIKGDSIFEFKPVKILLNYMHGADYIEVEGTLPDSYWKVKNSTLHFSVIGDIAVLQVKDSLLLPPKWLPIGGKNLNIGYTVYGIGFPNGRPMFFTSGIISDSILEEFNRTWPFEKMSSMPVFYRFADITIAGGMSGGPVILPGENGEPDKVVGILSNAILPYADLAKNRIEQYRNKYPQLKNMPELERDIFFLLNTVQGRSSGIGGFVSPGFLNRFLE